MGMTRGATWSPGGTESFVANNGKTGGVAQAHAKAALQQEVAARQKRDRSANPHTLE